MMRHTIVTIGVITVILLTLTAVSFRPFSTTELTALETYDLRAQDGIPALPVVERAARVERERSGTPGMIAFLTTHVQRFPEDEANGYYLTIVGELYQEEGATSLARQYFRRALLSHPDVTIRSVPVHRVAINRLLQMVEPPEERIRYLRYLKRRYPDQIDRGLTAYYLGKAYERDGRWTEAYESYREFLAYPGTRVPGEPDAYQDTSRRLAFYDSRRDWTYENLDDLVARIKNALWTQNPAALLQNRARENFFTMSWEQEVDDANSEIPTFDIAIFLRRSRVRYAEELDISSNANEAFLRTWGWSHRIPTWYLYFRRVDFPADPEIHGNWEWAGIYFGESM